MSKERTRQDTLSPRRIGDSVVQLQRLEILVDELIKDAPREEKIRESMEAAGLDYTADPIARMTCVLAALDDIRARERATEKDV